MSMIYWLCQGIGIRTNELYPHIDKVKFSNVLRTIDSPFVQQYRNEIDHDLNQTKFDINGLLEDYDYNNLADFLCFCDPTNTLTYGSNGEGESFFYYEPHYPWQALDNEPKSIREVHNRIIDAVQKITNLGRDEINDMIDDDIYEVGCG